MSKRIALVNLSESQSNKSHDSRGSSWDGALVEEGDVRGGEWLVWK